MQPDYDSVISRKMFLIILNNTQLCLLYFAHVTDHYTFCTSIITHAGHVACMGEESGAYKLSVEKPEGKRPLGRPRRRCMDNIRMDLQEVGCRYMDWIGLAQDRDRWRTLVSAVMNLRIP